VGAVGPPTYLCFGKPGEVPPDYDVVHGRYELETEGGATTPTQHETNAAENHNAPSVRTDSLVVVAPVEPDLRERSLLGKIWYGRSLVPIMARPK
jgi:hypothetical protein